MLATVPDKILANVVQGIPLQRLGTTAEVAHAVTFLLDDRSSYITGATLPVNGGMDM
jgi:NAD(P)-dependent dehydrogenase (short-subunit alcohol dehydrogenase family)